MTSTNDGKDVKSNLTSGLKGKKYHIEVYKSLEAHLSSEEALEERTRHVCEAWRRVYSLHQHSAPSTHPHLLSWLQRHTALTILQSEWQSSPKKDELHDRLSNAIDALVAEAGAAALPWEQQLLSRARWFRAALANPWAHPVLKSLLNDSGEPLSDQQVLEWLLEERGVVFVSRLRQLAASKRTNDLALALAGAVMDRARASRPLPADDDDAGEVKEDSNSFYAVLRRDAGFLEVWDLLTDIEFVLLHRREKRARCIELAKQTPLRDGYHLVERLRSRLETSPRDKKLWKNAKEVATLIAQVIIARCMVLTTCAGAGRTALYCCARSLARLVPPARLPAAAAALAAPAATARHLHTLCSAVHAQCAGEMKPFVCELYVRAITAGMNELERLKLNPEKEAETRAAEQTLASWFTQLGTLLGASERLRAECALTAFSVHPAADMLERVRQARVPPTQAQEGEEASAASTSSFGSWANDSRSQSNLVKTSETLQLKPSARRANVLSTALLGEGEALGLSPELGQDLAVLLAGPRLKTLSWDMDRDSLLEHCHAHMERTHGGTRALTTELRFLNLDPRAFLHLPEDADDEDDAYYGIEKGYEHLVQLEEPEEIWQNAFFDPEQTESANESDLDPQLAAKMKTKALPSSEDEDPLSLIADAKKQAKKDKRNESKERRKKTDKRDRRKDKEKTKKERKKKSDPAVAKIAKLPGEKRVRKKKERRREDFFTNVSVTDSDYDSQGKASQLSDNNDPSVLIDGLFPMDALKSPERLPSSEIPKDSTPVNSSSPTVINKIISAAANRPVLSFSAPKPKPSSSDSDVSRSRSPYITPHHLSNRHLVNDKVKRSKSKLLQFRRQKNAPKPAANAAPKLQLDKKQTQQLEAMNNLINAATEIKTEQIRKVPHNEPKDDAKLTSPQYVYSAQKQATHMPQNIVQTPSVFSDRNTYSDYIQCSPHKYSPYGNYTANQPPRPSSVIESSYSTPTRQTDKLYGLNLTPPKPANRMTHQTYAKSMQNLTQMDKPSPPPKQSEPKYYQYTNNKLQESSRLPVSAAEKPANHLQSPSSMNSLQQQYAAMSRANDFVKSYQTLADSRINHPRSSHNTPASANYSSPIQLSNSMQNILSDTFSAVSKDTRQVNASRAKVTHTNTQYVNVHSDLSNAREAVATYGKPSHTGSKQYSKLAKPSNTNAPKAQAKNTQLSEERQSKFKDFLKELQDTINAGVTDSGSFPPIVLNSQVKVTPVNPQDRTTVHAAKDTSAKQPKPAKKTEAAPNTFSRLSYMHKNKQSEIKNKTDAANPELNKLNMNILEHKMTKAKYMKNEVTISRVQKHVRANLQKKNPVLSSMLNASPVETCKGAQASSANINPHTTPDSITNREHADLLLLLRNQHTLKASHPNSRVPEDVRKPNVNTQTKDIPVPATHQSSVDNYAALTNKKTEPVIVHNPLMTMDGTKSDKQQDWESVMNAIRAHKTQPLGPNALDMMLNKDKKQTKSTKSHINHQQPHMNQEQRTPRSNSAQSNPEQRKRDQHSPRANSSTRKPSIEKHVAAPKDQSQTGVIKKTSQVEITKKPQAPNKQFTSNPLKQGDPFISGIRNSDYDLLEELMDDDLRQEIGELSSDEERYQAPVKVKGGHNPKTSVCTKTSEPPKAKPPVSGQKSIVCKNAPCLNVPDLNCARTVNAGSSTGYTNVIVNPVLSEATRLGNRQTVLCSNIETSHMANIVTNQPESHFIANIAPNHMEPPNMIITSVPAQPMMLISQGLVYDPYPTIRIHESQVSASLCNVAQNAFVALNPAPNIAVYQTTQFAAPVINPVFIGNAMTTTTNVTSATEQRSDTYDHQEIPLQNSIPAPVPKPTEDSNTTADRLNSDINMNKCNERKVLSQMQDNNTIANAEKDSRIRRLSINDAPPKTKQDEERIKMKRQALLNREINRPCFHPPIPLSYTPLCKKINLAKLLQQTSPKNGAIISNIKLRSSSTVVNKDAAANAKVEIPKSDTNYENLDSTDQASSTKENQKKSRRILLRSTRKLDNKMASRKIVRVPLCRNNFKPKSTQPSDKVLKNDSSVNNDKTKTETAKTPTRISKRIMNKTAKVDDTEKTKTTNSEISQVQQIKEESIEDKLNTDSGLIDFESALTASKIMIKAPSEPVHKILPEIKKEISTTDEAPTSKEGTAQLKPVILKGTRSVSKSTTKSIEPASVLEKIKSNLGDEIIIKSLVTNNTPVKKPIVITIKNRNQSKLLNNHVKIASISQPVDKIAKNIAVPIVTDPKLEIDPAQSTLSNKSATTKSDIAETLDVKIAKNNAIPKTEPKLEVVPLKPILLDKSVTTKTNIAKNDAVSKGTEPRLEIASPKSVFFPNKSVTTNSNITPPFETKIVKDKTVSKGTEPILEVAPSKPILPNKPVTTNSNIPQPGDSKLAKNDIVSKATEPREKVVPPKSMLPNKHVTTNSNVSQPDDRNIAKIDTDPKGTALKFEVAPLKPILPNEPITKNISRPGDSKIARTESRKEVVPLKPILPNKSVNTIANTLQPGESKAVKDNTVSKGTEPILEVAPLKSIFPSKPVTTNSDISQSGDIETVENNTVSKGTGLVDAPTKSIPSSNSVITNSTISQSVINNNAVLKATEPEIVPPRASTEVNNTNVPKTPVVESTNLKLDKKRANHKENLKNLQHKDYSTSSQVNVDGDSNKLTLKSTTASQKQALPDKVVPVVNKEQLLNPVNTPEKVTAKEAPSVKEKDNSDVILTNSETQVSSRNNITQLSIPTQNVNYNMNNPNQRKENRVIHKVTNQTSSELKSQTKSEKESWNASQIRKEDVVIEEIPIIGNQDQNKKCVRVKLPTGKTFKATVYGTMHVDYDTLFAEPAMRAILTEGKHDGKRFTLNIKQVSKSLRNNPTQIVGTKIHEIHIREKEVPIDTVNLISDDEDDDTRCFSTEFGKFYANIDLETLNKHQKKFDQKCTVKMKRDDIFKSNRTKPKPKSYPSTPISLLTRNKSKLVSEVRNSTVTAPPVQTNPIKSMDDLPPVYVKGNKPSDNERHIPTPMLLTPAVIPKEIIPDIIEIDDSSSDDESRVSLICAEPNLEPMEKLFELKNLLLKDLGVDKNKDKSTTMPVREKVTVDNLKAALLDDLGVSIPPPPVQIENQQKALTVTESTERKDKDEEFLKKCKVKKCVVKLNHCDNLVKKYEIIRNAKNCFVKLQRHEFSSGVLMNAAESNKTDTSESTELNFDCNEDFIDFDIEEPCSQQLSRCPSLSILNNLWDDTCQASTESLYGRSSPVMEVFDALVALHDKTNVKVEKAEKVKIWICESEWNMTKHACSVQGIFDTSNIEESNGLLSDCKYNEESLELVNVPKLVKIALKFLEDNADVVYRSHSMRALAKKALTKKTSNILKRKTEHVDDIVHNCKILKLGTLVINAINNYCDKADTKLTDNCRVVDINRITDSPLNMQVEQIENNLTTVEVKSKCYNAVFQVSAVTTELQDTMIRTSQTNEPGVKKIQETTETLQRNEDNLPSDTEDSSDMQNLIVKEIKTPNKPEDIVLEVKNALEPENVINTVVKIDEKNVKPSIDVNKIECEPDASVNDTEKEPYLDKIFDEPREVGVNSGLCSTSVAECDAMHTYTRFDDLETSAILETVQNKENDNENNGDEHDINMTISAAVHEMQSNLKAEKDEDSKSSRLVTTESDNDRLTMKTVINVECDMGTERTQKYAVDSEILNENSDVETAEARSCDIENQSSNLIDGYHACAVIESGTKRTLHNLDVLFTLDDSSPECNANMNVENSTRNFDSLDPNVTIEPILDCSSPKKDELVKLEILKQNVICESVPPKISLDRETCEESQSAESGNIEKVTHDLKDYFYDILVEIPISEIPHEACEVEIIDTPVNDTTELIKSDRPDAIKLELSTINTEALKTDCESDITSPVCIDDKEIVFNYHDYTKKRKLNDDTTKSCKQQNYNDEGNSSKEPFGSPAITRKPECKYEFIQEDDWLTVITTEHAPADIDTVYQHVHSNDVIEEEEIVTTENENAGVTLNGIEIEDPVIGTCYVFPINQSSSSESNTSSENLENNQATNYESNSENAVLYNYLHDIELCVIAPKATYSKRNLKRKMDMRDIKVTAKKYRKGKNIDCCKNICRKAYIREYKRLLDYCSSVKFSYSRPFHKEYVEVDDMTANWPIKSTFSAVPQGEPDANLFIDVHNTPAYQPDPATQTLVEEITYEYEKTDAVQQNPSSIEAYETNFDMGFGEGSGRVIQNLKKGDVSNISAATLSDVKQTQPVMSEDHDNCAVLISNKDDQMKKIRQYVNFIELRDKVRSFFKKSSVELKLDWMQQNFKECGLKPRYSDRSVSVDFPYDLCSLDYVKPTPTEAIVQVVQLGQLPVSAAAQNPVTCDPRVTQVSDASPSQCSVDNSPNDDSQSEIKTEYTELTTADLTLPLVQEYAQQNQIMNLDSHDPNNLELTEQTISLEMEIKAEERPEIKEELPDIKDEGSNSFDNADLHTLTNATTENMEYMYDNNTAKIDSNNGYDLSEQNSSETFLQQRQQNGSTEKTDQIAHAMSAAGITTMTDSLNNARAHALVNILSQKIRQGSVNTTQTTTNTYSKTTSINAMALQQALAQILPPPLNQTGSGENNQTSTPVGPQVLHIVQGNNASGNQITLVDNSQQSVISTPNATQVLHIVQNKGASTGQTSNGTLTQQPNSFSGLSLVDAGLQQGGNQLLHIVNTGSQKTTNAGQLLKRVNLLTNLANVQGSNEQKMVQFVCKSADGKAIQLNAPHQRSMVLRLQPIETSNVQTPPAKPADSHDLNNSPTNSANKDSASQQEIKSRSIYEENYAKFIQNSSGKPSSTEKSTSLPKFNQAFGKAVFQEGTQKHPEGSNSHISQVNTHTENSECPPTDNVINLDTMRQIGSPPLLIRKPPTVTTQSQSNIVQQIKQTIAPMNIQTMHGGVIYTRQIPVNIGGGQTINLITVPSTELINEESSKPQTTNQNEGEPSIIKIVPQNQNSTNAEDENNISATNETPPTPQPQPVLTQMRIKLPMLSKAPQMVPGARVVRPSFFQIQRNVIGGANQPVYQQLVLTAAPPLGQQTIRLPQAQASRPIKVPSESSSSESQMSSSTLEQLREFDMVLEQVKERSTVQPGTNSNNSSYKLQNNSSDATDGTSSSNCSTESTQVLYSIGNNQSLNVAYVNRKATVTTPTTSTFVRSPDSTGIADSPTSSTHVQIPHTITSDSSPTEMSQSKPAKVGSKSKSRPKSSSNPPNTLKLNSVPPKTTSSSSSQKPLEDEQTTQRILYILAEYKEQVENSPDKDKPAPRRRSNPPSNPGSSKRKKSSSSRRGTRDMSPVHGDDTCRTMGSEDSSCGTSQGDCNESCVDSHSPQDSPRKVARKITFDQELPATQPRQPQRNVIVADGQTITVARSATGKPATAVLMPANYILPVSMVKGGQQIAIVTNRGPKLLTVGGEAGAANALLLQRLIGPGGLKPVLARPGVRHVRLPTAALHNLQAFNLAPAPPELVEARAAGSPWPEREDVKPERGSSPEGSEPWNLASADAHDYTYEETVRTDNMERTVLDPVPGRYSPDMEAQRIFDKMFDVEKKSYVDSPRCAYDIDASDGDDKAYQVVQKKDGTHRQHRLSHVSAAALRHKYAILEHELRLQKSLSEECEDLGVDSPSASELFPEAELLFAASPAHEHAPEHDHPHQSAAPPPDLDDQLATDQLLLDDAPLDHEEFARAHPNTTFHSEPDEVQPFTITGLKGRHITSTIFHSGSAPATVLMAAPAPRSELLPPLKEDLRFDILADTRDIHQPNSTIVHSGAQVIRRVCYDEEKRERDARYLLDEPDNIIAGDDAKMVAEDSRDATLESMADVDDESSPERHAELFWESNSASERSERRALDFSSDSDKCCKSFDEASTDSSVGALRLDSVIKQARRSRSGSAGSDSAPPLRTYPAKRHGAGKTRAGERDTRRRAPGRGAEKRGCPCCAPDPPARPKKPRQRKPTLDFTN